MAHHARQSALTDELVSRVTHLPSQSKKARSLRELTLKRLRNHNFLRTNPFEVRQHLDGLEEKFRVYNEDPLADALRERLDFITKSSYKWAPEVLFLLLELSDQPASKSKIENIEFLKPAPEEDHQLTWEELAAEDPLLRDKAVFGTINYAADSSDDEGWNDTPPNRSEASDETGATSVDEYARRVEDFAINVDTAKLEKLREVQYWHKSSLSTHKGRLGERWVTGLQAIREVLFMLRGLPTSLFCLSETKQPSLIPVPGFSLKDTSPEIFYRILTNFSRQGTAIFKLRLWTQYDQSIPLAQVFQSEVMKRFTHFDASLSQLEANYVSLKEDTIVSILDVQSKLRPVLAGMLSLSEIMERLEADTHISAFRYLEMLFDEACVSQLAGNDELHKFLAEIFLSCLQTYLRPMRLWMERGRLLPNDKSFFVSEAVDKTDLAELWDERFLLRTTLDGHVFAPSFVVPLTAKAFTTGKSVALLTRLHKTESQEDWWDPQETLNFPALYALSSSLVPFSEIFTCELERWMMDQHRRTAHRLRETLFKACGLNQSLDALERVYFLKDGAASGSFLETIFEKLDSANSSWFDRFTLTELAHSTIGMLPQVSAERIKIKITSKGRSVYQERQSVKGLGIVTLDYLLPWTVQLIIPNESIRVYQAIFLFLAQIQRAMYVLRRLHLVRDDHNRDSSSTEQSLFFSLRARLLWFTSVMYSHVTEHVLEISTRDMRRSLGSASDLDDMIQLHAAYVERLTAQTLLSTRLEPIHTAIIAILDIAIKLGDIRTAHEHSQRNLKASIRGLELPRIRNSQGVKRARRDSSASSEDEFKAVEAIMLSLDDVDAQMTYAEHLSKMLGQCEHQCRFVATGLRGVARTGGQPSWDLLAERLELGNHV